MVVNEHVKDLLPAYALGCLDEGEQEQVSKHLASCSVCQAELRAYQAIANELPLAVPQIEPPPRLKSAVMERAAAGQPAPRPAPRRWRLADFFQRVSPVWSLASLVLIIGLLASNLFLWRQVNRLEDLSPALKVVNLQGSGPAPEANGIIVISMDGNHGTLVVDDLPPLEEDQQYQLWLVRDNQRASGGVFSVSRDGYGSLWVKSDLPLASYERFGITIEPSGGSPAPTGDRVLAGEL